MKLSTKGFSQGLPGVMKIVLILFLFVQPLAAWRKVNVRKQRTKVDWALEIQQLLEEDFPDAARLILVCDNLNTHKPGSLYEAFEPRKARRLAKRLRIHYTPKHGSWLNVAEIELSAMSRQCLDRRIATRQQLTRETQLWCKDRNRTQTGVDWQFTTEDARVKLRHLYPQYLIDYVLAPTRRTPLQKLRQETQI